MTSQASTIRPFAPARPFALAWIAYTAIILGFAAGVWIPNGLYRKMDFRSMYAAGVLARTDPSHLYDLARQKQIQDALVEKRDAVLPFGHLPLGALFYAPFSLLPYRTAYLLAIFVNSLLIIPCFLAAGKEFSATIPGWQPRPGLIFFPFMPTTIALAQGQYSLLLLLFLCLAWRFLDRSRVFAAGLVTAGLLLKPHLALLLALFLAVQYGWRFVAGFATGSATITAFCVPFLRHGGLRAWFGVLSGMSLASGNSQAHQAAEGVFAWSMPNLRGALLSTLGPVVSPRLLFILVAVASALVLVWALVVVRKLSPRNALVFSVVITLLVSYHLEKHDLVLLLLPMVLMETGTSKALARCRDAILGLPCALLMFWPSTPPGAGFTLMCIPLMVAAILLARTAASAALNETRNGSRELTIATQM